MSALVAAGLLALAASPVSAFWRLPCKVPIVVERADPIINPGAVSGHLHTIMGGNGFDFTMDYNSTQKSTCSSCTVIGDNSNYWTPTLFFQHQNGSFESVNQVGGATVYYLQRAGKGETLKAFPEGFRMVAGNPFKRTAGTDFASQAISYACLDYNGAAKPETGMFPNYNCPDGLRAQVFFPSCWNGKDLDTKDHMSHMSYPIDNYNSGSCPPDFPVHLVSIFFEVIWDTGKFGDQWYGNSQPFVWSQGDPTGYGGHGDFVMGWDQALLQKAVDTCTNESGRVEDCPAFKLIPDSQAEGCRVEPQINEQVSGILPALPGCNPVQATDAKPQSGCGAPSTMSQSNATFFTDLTSKGWSYAGCGADNYYTRILTGATTSDKGMTNEACVDFCSSKGFSVAGTEYSDECYCGNSIPDSGKPIPGVVGACTMKCSGDDSEFCGGSGPISLYQKCSGSSCTNANFGPGSSASGNSASAGVVSGGSSSGSAPSAGSTSDGSSSGGSAPAAGSSSAAASSSTPSTASAPTTMATMTTSATVVSPAQQTTTPSAPSASSPTSSPWSNSTSPTASNPAWSYTGCYTDTVNPRSLPKWSTFNGPSMTNDACIAFCDQKGFPVAGTEYAGQCFCGAEISSPQLSEENCDMACTGDASGMCGGAGALSVFSKGMRSKLRMHKRHSMHGKIGRS